MCSLLGLYVVDVRNLFYRIRGLDHECFFVIPCMNDGDPVANVKRLERGVVQTELVQMWDISSFL